MPAQRSDEGLSEVIGFILILGLITILISLYIVYVVPAEGRQNEIQHMNKVNDEFNQYKMAIDSLIVSGQLDKAIYNTFSLGTDQISSSSGGFFAFPLLKPAGSSGAILINNRNEQLTITSDVLRQQPGGEDADFNVNHNGPYVINLSEQPTHLYTNFTLSPNYITHNSNIHTSDIPLDSGLLIVPLETPTPWRVWINHTPRVDYISDNKVRYDTDLTITVEKNGVLILQEIPIKRGISNTSPNNKYFVDLLDPVYGLGGIIQGPVTIQRITKSPYIENEPISSSYGYVTTTFEEKDRDIGSLEFKSGNKYFIDQNYYYQMGGIFLEQNDGMVNRIPPSISLSRGTDNIIHLSIDEIIILGEGVLGGTSPIQVQSSIFRIENHLGYRLAFPMQSGSRLLSILIRKVQVRCGMRLSHG